jgi:hypothetical protein
MRTTLPALSVSLGGGLLPGVFFHKFSVFTANPFIEPDTLTIDRDTKLFNLFQRGLGEFKLFSLQIEDVSPTLKAFLDRD